MDKRTAGLLQEFCGEKGLRMDQQSGNLYGVRNGYHIGVMTTAIRNNQLSLYFSVSRGGAVPDQNGLRQAVKGVKSLQAVTVARYQVVFTVKPGVTAKRCLENLGAALDDACGILRTQGYQDCCQGCGEEAATASCMVSGGIVHLCENCYGVQSQNAGQRQQVENEKKENLVGGIVGALLGALVGVLAIVIFAQLGYVAAVSGVVMAVCTLKGYELLGGKLSKTGVVICVVMMVLMVYVGNWVDWALVAVRDLEVDFFTGFRAIPALLELGAIESGPYYGGLAMVYLFTVLGAVPTIHSSLQKKAKKNSVYVMN